MQMFLMAESRANRSSAEVLSACMQKEWRERLVEHALAVNQRVKNAWDWNTSRKRAERRRAELSTDALNKVRIYCCTLYASTTLGNARVTIKFCSRVFFCFLCVYVFFSC